MSSGVASEGGNNGDGGGGGYSSGCGGGGSDGQPMISSDGSVEGGILMQEGESDIDSLVAGEMSRCEMSANEGMFRMSYREAQMSEEDGKFPAAANGSIRIRMRDNLELSRLTEDTNGGSNRALHHPQSAAMMSCSQEEGGNRNFSPTRAMSSPNTISHPSSTDMATAGSDTGSISFPIGSKSQSQLPGPGETATTAASPSFRDNRNQQLNMECRTTPYAAAAREVESPVKNATMNSAGIAKFDEEIFQGESCALEFDGFSPEQGWWLTDAESNFILGGQARHPLHLPSFGCADYISHQGPINTRRPLDPIH